MTEKDKVAVPSPLPTETLYRVCNSTKLPFETTAELEPVDTVVAQDRAALAIRFAVGMKHGGYNLFAVGPAGTGK
jgi:hypothetical protein